MKEEREGRGGGRGGDGRGEEGTVGKGRGGMERRGDGREGGREFVLCPRKKNKSPRPPAICCSFGFKREPL